MRISEWSSDVCSSDLLRADPGGFQRRPGRVGGEGGGGFALARYVAGADAGALDDPFVARVHGFRQFGIADGAGRQGGARAQENGSADHFAGSSILDAGAVSPSIRSEEHTSELRSLMRISSA